MLKKLVSSVLSCVLLVSITSSVSAYEHNTPSSAEVLEQLQAIDFGREVEFFILDDLPLTHSRAQQELMNFDSIEEFEAFIQAFVYEVEAREAMPPIEIYADEEDFQSEGVSPRTIVENHTSFVPAFGTMGHGFANRVFQRT